MFSKPRHMYMNSSSLVLWMLHYCSLHKLCNSQPWSLLVM
uniref:Uncharacterized protein n=1 Tax=Anguilla anguilla TaxID=7936 RepID=A0A0E9SD24_ANGAN